LLTAVYQYQIREGWTVQPNFQYIQTAGRQIRRELFRADC
jgi:hypothetical protein